MKYKLKLLLILLSAALNAAFVGSWLVHSIRASSGTIPQATAPGTYGAMPELYQRVGMTEAQWREMRPQLETFRGSALTVFERVNQQRQELLSQLAAPQADRARIAEKQKQIRATQAEMQDLVVAHVLAEKDLLTPAQRQRYFELLAQRSGTLCENLMAGLRPAASSTDNQTGVRSAHDKE